MQRALAVSSRPPLALGLRLSVLEGCMAMLPQTYTSGVFLMGFALMLGADPWALGLMAAIPAFGQAAQLLTPLLLAKGVERKALTVWCASLSRYVWAPIALIPFLPCGAGERLLLFFGLLGLSTLLGQMAGVAWNDWMGDLVPEPQRGRYFGFRNAMTALVGMAVVGTGSRFLDQYHGAEQRWGFLALLGAALLGAIASQFVLSHQPDAGRARPRRAPFQAAMANKPFRRLGLVMFAWSFMAGLTGPFCYAYALKHLQVSYATLGLHALLVSALSILAQPLWGRLIDRKGAQFALVVTMVPICLHPIYWLVMRPDFLAPLWLDALSSGLFWSGVTLSTLALQMEVSPSGERAAYMGVYNAAMGLAAGLSALVGGALLSGLANQAFTLGAWTLGAWQLLLVAGLATRTACVAALAALPRLKAPTLVIETWPGGLPEPQSAEAATAPAN